MYNYLQTSVFPSEGQWRATLVKVVLQSSKEGTDMDIHRECIRVDGNYFEGMK